MSAVKHLCVCLFILVHFYDSSASLAQSSSVGENSPNPQSYHHSMKRSHKHKKHKKDALRVVAANDPDLLPINITLPSKPQLPLARAPPPAVVNGTLNGLYPDITACYDGIPRTYEIFARDRLEKRISTCSAVDANTTSVCHKLCILLNLELITTYTVAEMSTDKRKRRYKVNRDSECGHTQFGQNLLGIDTKIYNEQRVRKQKRERELYYEKINQLGNRNFDPDPFRMLFATVHGEDIVDERLDAQMRICRFYDITVENHECSEYSPSETQKLTELVECMETALKC